MNTNIKSAVQNLKSRTGQPHGLNSKGAYWVAASVNVRTYREEGEDTRTLHELELRHHRNGDVTAVVVRSKEDGSKKDFYKAVPAIVEATSLEEVKAALLGVSFKDGKANAFSSAAEGRLTEFVTETLGLVYAQPAPDEAPARTLGAAVRRY